MAVPQPHTVTSFNMGKASFPPSISSLLMHFPYAGSCTQKRQQRCGFSPLALPNMPWLAFPFSSDSLHSYFPPVLLGCIGPWGTKAQQPGTPLSDQEYLQFFEFLRITIQANTVCHLREMYGCKNSLVQRLDEYENHGVIPPGKANHDS